MCLTSVFLVEGELDALSNVQAGGARGAGDLAAAWWLHTLPNAHRWQPPLHDINTLPAPDAVARWVAGSLAAWAGRSRFRL